MMINLFVFLGLPRMFLDNRKSSPLKTLGEREMGRGLKYNRTTA